MMQANRGEIVLAKHALTGIVAAIDCRAVLFHKACEIDCGLGGVLGILNGKIVLITGAGQGVGQGIAYAMAS